MHEVGRWRSGGTEVRGQFQEIVLRWTQDVYGKMGVEISVETSSSYIVINIYDVI
jgi:uncharacterized protein YbcI